MRYSRVPRQSAVNTDRGALSSAIPLLYVALSRGGLPHRTKVMLIDVKDTQGPRQDNYGKYTTNIVYNEVQI